MTQKRKRKLDFISEEEKTKYLKEIIGFFRDERNEDIGFIAAEKVLEFFLQTTGEDIYKKAIEDVKYLIKERFDDLDIEMSILLDKRINQ